jgi:hypothetical protein
MPATRPSAFDVMMLQALVSGTRDEGFEVVALRDAEGAMEPVAVEGLCQIARHREPNGPLAVGCRRHEAHAVRYHVDAAASPLGVRDRDDEPCRERGASDAYAFSPPVFDFAGGMRLVA